MKSICKRINGNVAVPSLIENVLMAAKGQKPQNVINSRFFNELLNTYEDFKKKNPVKAEKVDKFLLTSKVSFSAHSMKEQRKWN